MRADRISTEQGGTGQPVLVGRIDSPLQWHEAVTLVRAVVDGIADGRLRCVPALGELALDTDGSVHAVPGVTGASRRQSGDELELTSDLRQLLRELLDATAPSELRALAEEGDGERGPGGIDEFTQALAFFERPSKEKDLRALAGRLRQVQEERQLEMEMERLTHKTRTDERPPDGVQPERPVAPRKASLKPRLVVLAGACIVGAGALVFLVSGIGSGAGPSGPAALVARTSGGLLASLRAAADSAFPASVPARAAADTGKAPVPIQPTTPSRRRAGQAFSSAPHSQPRRSVEIFRAREPEVIEVPVSWDRGSELPRYSMIIYDRRNADVMPATLLRPHLPTIASPAVPRGRLGKLEVLVAEDGHVERVRLLATTIERRYYDAMILSAVKAWIFRPASRGGQPVRYRVEIPLT